MADLGEMRGQRRVLCERRWSSCLDCPTLAHRLRCDGCNSNGTRWVTQDHLTNLLYTAFHVNETEENTDG